MLTSFGLEALSSYMRPLHDEDASDLLRFAHDQQSAAWNNEPDGHDRIGTILHHHIERHSRRWPSVQFLICQWRTSFNS
jgi:hypothetical protein